MTSDEENDGGDESNESYICLVAVVLVVDIDFDE